MHMHGLVLLQSPWEQRGVAITTWPDAWAGFSEESRPFPPLHPPGSDQQPTPQRMAENTNKHVTVCKILSQFYKILFSRKGTELGKVDKRRWVVGGIVELCQLSSTIQLQSYETTQSNNNQFPSVVTVI